MRSSDTGEPQHKPIASQPECGSYSQCLLHSTLHMRSAPCEKGCRKCLVSADVAKPKLRQTNGICRLSHSNHEAVGVMPLMYLASACVFDSP
jgi:hypothetical protein